MESLKELLKELRSYFKDLSKEKKTMIFLSPLAFTLFLMLGQCAIKDIRKGHIERNRKKVVSLYHTAAFHLNCSQDKLQYSILDAKDKLEYSETVGFIGCGRRIALYWNCYDTDLGCEWITDVNRKIMDDKIQHERSIRENQRHLDNMQNNANRINNLKTNNY